MNLYSVSRVRWDNRFPHNSSLNEVPSFFRKCIIEFKYYFQKHRRSIHEPIDSKIIYWDLIRDRNHVPTSILRNPENLPFFKSLYNNRFSDPFIREFLFRLYHHRLIFKRYKLNINDMLNFGQRCNSCFQGIDTPKHCFEICSFGQDLRYKRNDIISKLNQTSGINIVEENYIYCNIISLNRIGEIMNYILALSNYAIYTTKIKKLLDPSCVIQQNESLYIFKQKLKQRIFCDHVRMGTDEFRQVWDNYRSNDIVSYNDTKIISWNF